MSKQDPYSRENIVAAINLIGGTPAEKRTVLRRMTAEVELMALDQGDIDIALQEAQVLEDDGRPTAAECIRACARAAQRMLRSPTERERLEMCGPDPVRNEELGL